MSKSDLDALEPGLVWAHFAALTRIARPPKREEAARAHVVGWANALGFSTDQDAAGNIVVRAPASPGREHAAAVVLQAHLDMVCEREPDSPFDPLEGRIKVVLNDGWVAAEGTTLGADDGMGVAAAMAAAEDTAVRHGPLELLFTVSEEQGLEGAKGLDPALVSGRRLINLDGTNDRGITVGCAGSTHSFVRFSPAVEPVPADALTLRVRVFGARGGHSGADIARGRVNAVKTLGRILGHAHAQAPFRLARLHGGVSRNAIPREARAVVSLAAETEPAFRSAADAELAAVKEQHRGSDDGVSLVTEQGPALDAAWSQDGSARALDLVQALPTGVVQMNPDLPGVVETSTSLTVAQSVEGVLTLGSMTRSSSTQALEDAVASIQAIARLAGAGVEILRSYGPWQPDLGSELLALARANFLRLFGPAPELIVVHGGLECAVIGERLRGVEMISLGPEIVGPHAPGERVSVPATQRFYRLLGALLDDLSR